jgi:hypothetical protein
VTNAAYNEGIVTLNDDPENATALHRAINELSRHLSHWHFTFDGCLEDRPTRPLGSAYLLLPGETPEQQQEYRYGCDRLGVDPRPEGWALWHTWDHKERAHTMVTTLLDTTAALLESWTRGRDRQPVEPLRAQIKVVVRGWLGPTHLSPGQARAIGLGGR